MLLMYTNYREAEPEAGARAMARRRHDKIAAKVYHRLTGKRQTQSQSGTFACDKRPNKRLTQMRGDARPGVFYKYLERVVFELSLNINFTGAGHRLNGSRDEIVEHAFDASAIAERFEIAVDIDINPDFGCLRGGGFDSRFDDAPNRTKVHISCFAFRNVQ